ncbi:diacylglycerol kinase [Oceanidesulfovibrio marinus]|uniref:Diacylglycerol kinase family protein n=1 Tax=Oceanidesulfovibrio marinus TaxID=370038 RepID=A0ABX6NFH5_9BACT|nr:diacylglycerol kinase family protein [Oceanidesulfovibrio marinus]QJT09362.1 diacylglycerol kinase family protein [Oceanidesulfovibrio marinus]
MRRFLKSAGYALSGIVHTYRSERNMRTHTAILAVILLAALVLGVSRVELAVILAIAALVLCLELANTAVENLADVVSPERDPRIGIVKDCMAGAVMLAACFSVAIGVIIFLPKLAALLGI